MFLGHLNETQKEQLLVFAHQLTMADGEDSTDEEEALRRLATEAGITNGVDGDRILAPIDVSPFDTGSARVAATLEILVLAFKSEFLHEAESRYLGKLAGAMGFEQDHFNSLVNWAHGYGQAARRGDTHRCDALKVEAAAMIAAVS